MGMSANTHTTSTLNDLIETLKDGQEGFKAASEQVKRADLKALFAEYSAQRSQFAAELQNLDRQYGETHPPDSGTVAGAAHRGWINIKSKLTGQDDHAVLAECERGEDVAVSAYKDALNDEELAPAAYEVLRTQFADVKAAHDRIKTLRDAAAAAS